MPISTPEGAQLLRRATVAELLELALERDERGSEDAAAFRREGTTWTLRFAGKQTHVRHRMGLEYIAHLLANPAQRMPVMSLYRVVMGGPAADTPNHSHRNPQDIEEPRPRRNPRAATPEVLADRLTLQACEQRLHELQTRIDEAGLENDNARLQKLQEERLQLNQYLASCNGHNGELRRIVDARERVRKSVSNAISRAIADIFTCHEPLGRHLRNRIRTGYEVTYDPERAIEWQL